MEQQSIEGLYGMIQLRTLENLMRSEDQQIELIGILPNKFKTQRNRQHEHLDALREKPTTTKLVMPHVMHDWTAYADDAHSLNLGGTSLFKRPPSDKARQEFQLIYNDINARVF
jgi:cellulose biosynthesis protein BcsQ